MSRKYIILFLLSMGWLQPATAQEMHCKAIVNANQIQNVDKKIFSTLEKSIETFINTRKWTEDTYNPEEKVEIVISIVIQEPISEVEGGYKGSIAIQSGRPVYNTNYTSPIINYTDKDVAFKYIQFQPLDYNDNQVKGSEPLSANLTALLAYYTYLTLGFDYDSYELKSGSPFFTKALNIANNAPEHRQISGWKSTENRRNRYWLVDQVLNNRFDPFRTVFYNYHRLGLDNMTGDAALARNTINATIPVLQQINSENPSSILMQFFFNAKGEEYLQFMQQAPTNEKQQLVPMLSQLDVRNAQNYSRLLR